MKSRGDRSASSKRRLPVWGVLLLACTVWFAARLLWVPTTPFTLDLGSNRPLAGSIAYDTVLPWARHVESPIEPSQVSIEGARSRPVTVTITPLGQVDHRSRGAEVWLLGVSSRLTKVDQAWSNSLHLPASWKRDGKALVNATGTSEPLRVSLRADGYVSVTLLKHPYSGSVRVTVGDTSLTLDLYREGFENLRVRILTPVDLEAAQHVEVPLPIAARSVSMALSGPRIVRLKAGSAVVGSDARIIGRNGDTMTLDMPGPQGRIEFPGAEGPGLFAPRWQEFALMLAFVIGVLGIRSELARRRRPSS